MGLFARIGPNIGKVVSPLRASKILEIPIPELSKTVLQSVREYNFPGTFVFGVSNGIIPEPSIAPNSVPQSNFQRALVFRVPKAIITEPPIAPNLLFSLSEIQIQSEFQPILSKVYVVKSWVFQEPSISQDMVETFPATGDLIEMLPPFEATTWISGNLFVALGSGNVSGKRYGEQKSKGNMQTSLLANLPTSAPKGEFKKAYSRTKTPNSLSTHVTHTLTFWDLIYPSLLPPLDLDFVPQFDILSKLRPYQQTGITFLVERKTALLADEMGTGKTVMSVVALRLLFRLGNAKKALIVCPVSILRVWQDHLNDWANELAFTVVRGTKDVRKLDWTYPAHVYLTTYDTVASDFLTVVPKKKHLKCQTCGQELSLRERVQRREGSLPLFRCPFCNVILDSLPVKTSLVDAEVLDTFDVVILDEAQYIKNPSSDRSQAVKLMNPEVRWAITGTPIENRLEDLVSIFGFVKPHYLRSQGLTPRRAADQIKPYFLRRLKKDVMKDLPPKVRQETWLELDQVQRIQYEQALQGGRTKLEKLGDQISKIHIFAVITALKQICNFAGDQDSSPKTNALIDLVEEIKDSGQKVIVFSQYDDYGVARLEPILQRFGVTVMRGGMSDSARNASIDRFKNDPATSVFLSTVKTGGLGITLTEASYVVHFDHWWNPATMWQAEDRAHRHGQKLCVNIYSFWMQNTIEERIYRKLEEKGLLFEEVINGLSVDAIEQMISTDEWLDMLGVKKAQKLATRDVKPHTASPPTVSDVLKKISSLSPTAFEEAVKMVFAKLGFSSVSTEKHNDDGGIDLIGLRQLRETNEKVMARCTRMERLGVEAASELLGTIVADQSLSRGFLVTSGTVSAECRAFCETDGRLSVIDGLGLATYIVHFGVPA